MTNSERRQAKQAGEDAAMVAVARLGGEASTEPGEADYLRIPAALRGNAAAIATFERTYREWIEAMRAA